jgi:hypothetical protein
MASDWGPNTFGDPCRECGHRWSISADDAQRVVEHAPSEFADLIHGATGGERIAELKWSVTEYVFHVADNLRIWADRVSAASGGVPFVSEYDSDQLAVARGYAAASLSEAHASLRGSVSYWTSAISASDERTRVEHPIRGLLTVSDIVGTNSHDTAHHQHDVARILGTGAMGSS